MRNLLLTFLIMIATIEVSSQDVNKKVDYEKIVSTYEEICTPYLEEIAAKKFNYSKFPSGIEAIHATHNALIADVWVLNDNVIKKIKSSDSLVSNSTKIMELLDESYKETFPDLPKKFYREVKDELKKKGF